MELTDISRTVIVGVWTEDYHRISYLYITLHHNNFKWELTERVLCTFEWEGKLSEKGRLPQTSHNVNSQAVLA